MLKPVIIGGRLIEPLPTIAEIRERARAALAEWPSGARHTGHSPRLEKAGRRDARTGMKAFFDIDTQNDFVVPGGALYGPGGERVIPVVAALNRYAADRGITLISTMMRASAGRARVRGVAAPLHCRH